jgi:hypothetical protein
VRVGDNLYVRSVNGPTAAWFRGTQVRHEGWIAAGGIERDVTLVDIAGTDRPLQDAIDAAYRTKYRRYAAGLLDHITSAGAQSATLQLVPR